MSLPQTEDFVVKYLWSAVGYCLIAIPSLGKKQDGMSIPQRTESESPSRPALPSMMSIFTRPAIQATSRTVASSSPWRTRAAA